LLHQQARVHGGGVARAQIVLRALLLERGHVGLVVGEDRTGNLLVLGGNQGDAVRVSAFGRARVVAYRWPPAVDVLPGPPVLALGDAALSVSEA
jgi:hypothetical protein